MSTIRPATSEDVDAIARIWHAGWLDGHAGNVPPELVAHRNPEQFAPRARHRLETTWVAETEAGPLPVPCHRYEVDLTDG